jgi:hypothetical protein
MKVENERKIKLNKLKIKYNLVYNVSWNLNNLWIEVCFSEWQNKFKVKII